MLAVAVICLSLGFGEEYKEKQNTAAIDSKKGKEKRTSDLSLFVPHLLIPITVR